MSQQHLFCFGLGFTGSALGETLLKDGWNVSGTCRTEEEQSELKKRGFDAYRFDGTRYEIELLESLASANHILSTIPPGDTDDPVLFSFKQHLAQKENLSWVGYLSTTGVYGNRDGSWVDEDSETRPISHRGQKRLATEQAWQNLLEQHSVPLHIFRLSAIYGPGRNSLKRVLEGKARRIDQPGLLFSRIHLADLVQVLYASIKNPSPGRIYNVGDDLPAPPEKVIRFACELLNTSPPPLKTIEEAGLSNLAKSFYEDSKRVSNKRMKKELGVRLLYPDYKAGLTDLLKTLDRD